MDRSDQQLAEIRARLDALGAPKVRAPRAAKKAPAPSRTAKAAPATRATPKAKAAPKVTPAAEPVELVFDYEEQQAPAPPLLLNRRPAARPRGSDPRAGA